MPATSENVAVSLLRMSIADQLPSRSFSSIVETMVEKYGARGYKLASDSDVRALLEHIQNTKRSTLSQRERELSHAIMSQGLRHLVSEGWNARDIVEQTLTKYGARTDVPYEREELRTYVRSALTS